MESIQVCTGKYIQNICCNFIIFSGVINTNFHECFGFDKDSPEYAATMDSYAKLHPIGRMGETDECVQVIAFLAADGASFVTGVNLPIDGGLNVKCPT